MIEIRFHGRGGQGAVVASEVLAQAAFLEGRHPQSFPFFGVERRGAPVTAYTRIDDRPIRVRTHIATPDIVVVLDPGLPRTVDVVDGLKPEGLLLVNSTEPPDRICAGYRVRLISTDEPPEWIEWGFSGRTATVDATGIALAQGLGTRSTPIVNTAILGALARVGRVVGIDAILRAIRERVPAKPEENARAARDAYDRALALEEAIA